jgi:hypothetical protein
LFSSCFSLSFISFFWYLPLALYFKSKSSGLWRRIVFW